MKRILIFGNSGSGKSTLARSYAKIPNVKHLDLDEIAWEGPRIRRNVDESILELKSFASADAEWVIEGCYGSLISEAALFANEMIFLNPGTDACEENCKSRQWEPHKYKSKEEQDNNLNMLLDWVAEYYSRTDEFSYLAHREIFDSFNGIKRELNSNTETQTKVSEATAVSRVSS